jgi:hypothetical protein
MKYTMDRSGIGKMLRSHPQIHRSLHSAAQRTKRIAQSRVPVRTGALRSSGRVEDLGVRPVVAGDPRMTVAVVFHSRYAMDIEKRTGFLSGSLGTSKAGKR